MSKRLSLAVLIVALCLAASGCASKDGSSLFSYASADAEYTAVFPSEYGDVIAGVTKTDGEVFLTVVSPERSAGMRVTVDAGNTCTLYPQSGDGIRLSRAAAEGLTGVISLLSKGESEVRSVKKTDDGAYTSAIYDDGEVTLDGNGLPVAVTVRGDGERTVSIKDYKITAGTPAG